MVGAQIAGILIITKHEQIDTLTSKALSWVPKESFNMKSN